MTKTLCGAILCGDTFVPVEGDSYTGACSYTDPVSNEERLVFEVSIALPTPVDFSETIAYLRSQCLQGIIRGHDYTLLIVDSKCVKQISNTSGMEKQYSVNVWGG